MDYWKSKDPRNSQVAYIMNHIIEIYKGPSQPLYDTPCFNYKNQSYFYIYVCCAKPVPTHNGKPVAACWEPRSSLQR